MKLITRIASNRKCENCFTWTNIFEQNISKNESLTQCLTLTNLMNLKFDFIHQVIKTRLQLQGELAKQDGKVKIYRGVLHAFYQVGKHDGIHGLQKGLVPALGFQFVLNFFRCVSSHRLPLFA